MAYIVDYDVTYAAAAAANTICNMPQHQTGDLLLAIVTLNSGAPSTGTGGTAGWATWTTNATVTTNTSGYSWLKATADNNTLSLTTADDYCCTIISIRDWDGTTPFDVTPNLSGSTTASSAPANVAITPTNNNTLTIYMMSVAGVATAVHSPPGFQHLISYDNQGTNDANSAVTQSICWSQHRTGGTAVPVPTWDSSLSGAYARATFAIRNATSGTIPAYIDDSTLPATKLFGGHSVLNGVSLSGSLTLTGNMTNGKTTSFVAGSSTNGADLGVNPFSSGFAKTSATQAATSLTGFEVNVGTQDFTTDLLVGSVIGGTPKMGAFGIGSINQGGCVVRVGTGASVWKAYQVAAKDASPSTAVRSVFCIQPGYTGSQYGTAGSYTGASGTTYIQCLSNQPSFSSTVIWSEFYRARAHIIAGGDAVSPVDTDGMASVGKSYRLPVIQKSGGAGILSYVPIQIGGGDAVNFQIDAGALQFPQRYDTAKKEISYHAADGKLGISYAGKSGDVIKHTNSVITSPTRYYWEINSAATNAATWDFTGLVIVNANVTLRNVMIFDNMSFSNCGTITASDSDLTNCSIAEPPATSGSLVVNANSSFNNCSFDTTTITAGNYLVTTGDPSIFIDCNFSGSGTSGHAIRITTPGTYTFTGNKFTGYGGTAGTNLTQNSGSTSAAILNESGGSVTLSIAGGDSPSVRNVGTGSVTTISASKTFTITNVVYNSEVRIYKKNGTSDEGDDTELAGVDAIGVSSPTGGTVSGPDSNGRYTLTYAHSLNETVNVVVVNTSDLGSPAKSYQPYFLAYTLNTTSDQSLLVSQILDRNFANP